ncbi:MAG: hypothetical protein JW971_07200 [Synergistales bacterium]|nr:hypothetical protein [Synergistales bacterium]
MVKRKTLPCICIALVILTAALGFPPSSRAEVTPSACDLFTSADAEALFEEDVSEGVLRDAMSPAGQSCRYSFQRGVDVFGITLRVATDEAIAEEGIYDSAKDVFERQVKARKNSENASKTCREIENLGDGALWEGTSLWVLKEDLLMILKVNSVLEGSFDSREALDEAQEEQNLELSLKAAETVLTKLE